ncbi:MAG TPA: hypothetical protein VE988_08380 [Gemmataceae bacterium]|nr:hypothetical protein [Gemmataceae bacterium]
MSMKQQEQQPQAKQHAQDHQQHTAAIETQVMEALGRPGNLHRVQVRQVWEDHYRVNVFVGLDATSATVAHSYFLVADGDGKVVSSNPKIGKRY